MAASRRQVLVTGLGVTAVSLAQSRAGVPIDLELSADSFPDQRDLLGDEIFQVVRGLDSLVLTIRAVNMTLQRRAGGTPGLSVTTPGRDRLLVVDFTTQSVGETTSTLEAELDQPEYDIPTSQDKNGYRARAFVTALRTRLVFRIPDGITTLSPSLERRDGRPGLLSWSEFEPVLPRGIRESAGYTGPTTQETQICVPYGMQVAPDGPLHNWIHSANAVTRNGRTELWHTRLGRFTGSGTIDLDLPGVDGGLAVRALREYPAVTPRIRAVYSNKFDYASTTQATVSDSNKAPLPLTVADRQNLVRLMSDYVTRLRTGGTYVPTAAVSRKLHLSSGGATLDASARWDPPLDVADVVGGPRTAPGIALDSWSHQMTQGRDHRVVVTYVGYLLPFGHPVILVKQTERRFESRPFSRPAANLRTRVFLKIRDPERTFGPGGEQRFEPLEGRALPFTRVRINSATTPNITFQRFTVPNEPAFGAQAGRPVTGGAFILDDGAPYLFDLSAWDHEGRQVDFQMPMAFVNGVTATVEGRPQDIQPEAPQDFDDLGNETGFMRFVRAGYNAVVAENPMGVLSTSQRVVSLLGAPVALAPASTSGSTTVEVDRLVIGLTRPTTDGDEASFAALDQVRSFPVMAAATARIKAVQQITPGGVSRVSYDPTYLDRGFTPPKEGEKPNESEIFLGIAGQAAQFASDSGIGHPGVFTPNSVVTALSRVQGAVGGAVDKVEALVANATDALDEIKNSPYVKTYEKYAGGDFDFRDILADAQLLGGINLVDVISAVLGDFGSVPLLDTTVTYAKLPNGEDDITRPTAATVFDWRPKLQAGPPGLDIFVPGPNATMRMYARLAASYTGDVSSEITGRLTNFELRLLGQQPFLIFAFRELSFESRNGSKPSVTPDITDVRFAGALEFVNALEDFLQGDGSGNGISVTPTQITAGISLAIPSVTVGVFSLSNLSFNLSIEIPFTNQPVRVRFGFSSRENPFTIAVMCFAGGGFVGVTLSAKGLELLEIALEFGAQISLDFGIAAASLEIKAGIYFAIGIGSDGPDSQMVQLTGYVRARGEVVFAIASAAVTFQLSLTYIKDGAKSIVYGEAEVTVEVDVVGLGGSFSFDVRKEFAGGGDPTFADMVSPAQFDQYADAFA